MQITKQIIASLPLAYSIAVIPPEQPGGPVSIAAGSEGDGPLLYMPYPGAEPEVLASAPGGFISLQPWLSLQGRFLLASTDFKPTFQAAECSLWAYPLDAAQGQPPICLGAMPYAHRIAAAICHRKPMLLASTLCSGKAYREDWSQPGGIFMARLPETLGGSLEWRQLAHGLTKNHGMDYAQLGGAYGNGYLVSAMEGLFFLRLPDDLGAKCRLEQLAEGEHSDAFAFDWRGCGVADVFAIRPFHGHILSRYRFEGGVWRERIIADDLPFGHVVWAGIFLGKPALIAGARRGAEDLRLYRTSNPDADVFTHELIDEGVGAAQLQVVASSPDRAQLFVSGRGMGQVLVYTCTR